MAMASNYVNVSRTMGAMAAAFSDQDRADAITPNGGLTGVGGIAGRALTWEDHLKQLQQVPQK